MHLLKIRTMIRDPGYVIHKAPPLFYSLMLASTLMLACASGDVLATNGSHPLVPRAAPAGWDGSCPYDECKCKVSNGQPEMDCGQREMTRLPTLRNWQPGCKACWHLFIYSPKLTRIEVKDVPDGLSAFVALNTGRLESVGVGALDGIARIDIRVVPNIPVLEALTTNTDLNVLNMNKWVFGCSKFKQDSPYFPTPDFSKFTKATQLNICSYNIVELPRGLERLKSLIMLWFANSRIRYLGNNFPPSMIYLFLNGNLIVTHANNFPKSLEYLNLDDNKIITFNFLFSDDNNNLKWLNMNNNPIDYVIPGAVEQLKALTELKLENTNLARLPMGLGSLSKLRKLDFAGHDISCTCEDAAHAPFLPNLIARGDKKLHLSGSCKDGMKIEDFLRIVVPNCKTLKQYQANIGNALHGNALKVLVALVVSVCLSLVL